MTSHRSIAPQPDRRPARLLRDALLLGSLGVALGAFADPAQAQSIDLSVSRIELNQSIQGGFTPLVGGRPTFVRTTIKKVGTSTTPTFVDGILRIYADGIEVAGSPVFSDNGPVLVKSPANYELENDTLNFILIAPTSNNVSISVTVNPPGPNYAPESDPSNNTKTVGPVPFPCRKTLELAYAPIDYRPSGGALPNLPDPALIEPGMGDNFVHGIYPTPDWNYHRIDAPSKLWTSSLAASGSPLLAALDVDLQLMVPPPDILYGFVPGSLPYNGQSILSGKVSMGNTELIRYQRTIAHELGHNFGLQHNNLVVGLVGVDVEDHLLLTQNLPTIKSANLFDIMVAGLLTDQAWVTHQNYSYFHAHAWVQCVGQATAVATGPNLILAGAFDTRSNEIACSHALTIASGQPTQETAPQSAQFVVRSFVHDSEISTLHLPPQTVFDSCSSESHSDSSTLSDPLRGFSCVVPALDSEQHEVDRVVISHLPSGRSLELTRSAHAPTGEFETLAWTTTPAGDLRLTLAWSMGDPDGDPVRAYLRFSPNGQRWIPLLTSSTTTQFEIDPSTMPFGGHGQYELTVSDGLRTTRTTRSAPLGPAPTLLAGAAPTAFILSPDPNTSYLERSSVILHGSGFDLEDRMLQGTSLEWRSSLDGSLGTGRVALASHLSLGTHAITLTATDSSGLATVDSATITILDRELPDAATTVCQQNLGFQGPGSAVLTLCGGDLSAGTSADLSLSGATANQVAFVVVGLTNGPAPFLGGVLVPLPIALLVPVTTDAGGGFTLPGIQGGGGPLSSYAQVVYSDPGATFGYGISNALRVDLLP